MLTALLVVALGGLVQVEPARAQTPRPDSSVTRRAMIARVTTLEQRAATLPEGRERNDMILESMALRERLRDGDFNVGDRIVLRVQGVPALSDTFALRAGKILELPNVAPIPLAGVLRGELQPYLRQQLSQYIINPVVEAHPLIRVGVLGAVSKPGYYAVRPDQVFSDALMAAGGPTAEANVARSTVRRGDKDVWKGKRLEDAIASGQTLDDMNLRSGDQILVDRRADRNWTAIIGASSSLAALLATLYFRHSIW